MMTKADVISNQQSVISNQQSVISNLPTLTTGLLKLNGGFWIENRWFTKIKRRFLDRKPLVYKN